MDPPERASLHHQPEGQHKPLEQLSQRCRFVPAPRYVLAALPEYTARPSRSIATHEETVGQDTPVSAWPSSICSAALQLVPLKPNTRPSESTARQNVGVGQDTPVSPEASEPDSGGSCARDAGAENVDPFQVSTAPALSTATQKVGLAHETALS